MTPGLRIVPHAQIRPHACAMWPQLGARHPKGYFDVGSEDPEGWNHSYVSVEFVEQAARELGWISPGDALALGEKVEALMRKVEDLEAEVREADRFAESAEYTLAHFGERVRKKPGRPRKEAVE